MLTHRDEAPKFDLETTARELRRSEQYQREGQAARTLIRSPNLRIVLVVLAAGRQISEHHASVSASVQAVSGSIRLQLPDRSVKLGPGELLVLEAGLAHDVHAESESTFVLTLGWPKPS